MPRSATGVRTSSRPPPDVHTRPRTARIARAGVAAVSRSMAEADSRSSPSPSPANAARPEPRAKLKRVKTANHTPQTTRIRIKRSTRSPKTNNQKPPPPVPFASERELTRVAGGASTRDRNRRVPTDPSDDPPEP